LEREDGGESCRTSVTGLGVTAPPRHRGLGEVAAKPLNRGRKISFVFLFIF